MKPEKLQLICALISQEKIAPNVNLKTMYQTIHETIISDTELRKLTDVDIVELSKQYVAEYFNSLAEIILSHESNLD